MKLIIDKIKIKNFKGLKEQEIKFNPISTNICGENATGKTTVFDAFTWLLFDKDSQDNSQFGIKTFNSSGQVLHGLEHEVEGVLEVDNKEIVLKKIYKEKWTKRRGQSSKQLTGHTTDYYIDDVPLKKNEYTEYINSLIDENIFKLITNPLYFNVALGWKERRDILLEVVGDVSDEDVINFNKDLEKLSHLLGDKDLETFKKMIASRKKKLNEDIKSIPYRIDELNNSIEEIEEQEAESIKFKIQVKQRKIEKIDNQILDRSKIYEKNSKIKTKIYKKKDELTSIKDEQRKQSNKPKEELQQEIFDLKSNLNAVEYDIKTKEEKLKSNKEVIAALNKEKEKTRSWWYEENEKTFEFNEEETICPTCKQQLPIKDIENKKTEMIKNFQERKKEKLEEITSGGKVLVDKINNFESENKSLEKEIKDLNLKNEELSKELSEKEEKYKSFILPEFTETKEYKDLENQIIELEKEIVEPDETAINELKEKKKDIEKEIDNLKYQIRAQEHNEKTKKRIKELEARERELANQIAEIEGQEYMTEEFIKTKVDLLEDKINSKFKMVRFKLFNTLVNGGIEPACETLIQGVPYTDANNAAKINAGLDIINTLTKHYNVSAPVFVDNKESINDLINCDSQIVNFIVTRDSKLVIKNNEEAV